MYGPKGAHGSMLTCLFILHAMGGLDPPGSFLDPPGRSWAVMAGQVAGHGLLDTSRPPNWALLLPFSLYIQLFNILFSIKHLFLGISFVFLLKEEVNFSSNYY